LGPRLEFSSTPTTSPSEQHHPKPKIDHKWNQKPETKFIHEHLWVLYEKNEREEEEVLTNPWLSQTT